VVLARVSNLATERGLDGEEVKRIFEILIKMNIDRQHELSGEGNLP
jgi:chorismate mutase